MEIRRAQRSKRPFKGCIAAPAGAGKTYTALSLAQGMKNGGRILLIDTENNSSELYAEDFDFDVLNVPEHSIDTLIAALRLAVKEKYDVIIVDSLTHAWQFVLEEKNKIDLRGGNSFSNWAKVNPQYEALLNAIGKFPAHLICTMRAKTSYVLEENEKGKQAPRKVGMGAVFRDGGEYEFDFYATMDLAHNLIVEKSRINFLADQVIAKPGKELGQRIRDWLTKLPHTDVTLTQGESFKGQALQALSLPELVAYYNKYSETLPEAEKADIEARMSALQKQKRSNNKGSANEHATTESH